MVVESANEAEKPEQSPIAIRKDRHPGWGGRRPGAGAPKGNLNALKHGRNSRRQAQLVEALMQVPQSRDTLIALGKAQPPPAPASRGRRRRPHDPPPRERRPDHPESSLS